MTRCYILSIVQEFCPVHCLWELHALPLPALVLMHSCGPYCIMEVQSNCLLLRPVDKPDTHAILVSMDRVIRCL